MTSNTLTHKYALGNNARVNAKKVDVTRVLYRFCFVNEMNFQRQA